MKVTPVNNRILVTIFIMVFFLYSVSSIVEPVTNSIDSMYYQGIVLSEDNDITAWVYSYEMGLYTHDSCIDNTQFDSQVQFGFNSVYRIIFNFHDYSGKRISNGIDYLIYSCTSDSTMIRILTYYVLARSGTIYISAHSTYPVSYIHNKDGAK